MTRVAHAARRVELIHQAARRYNASACLTILLCLFVVSSAACVPRASVSVAISDQEFWSLIESISEPAGTFSVSENLVSNEPHVAENVRWLRPRGGAYIGVGPEQNFSYIARLRPTIAFIVDVRRENRNLHLFYKALFELSSDRADFVSRLFSRPRPAGLGSTATSEEIFRRYESVPPSREQYSRNTMLVRERLLTRHGLPLSQLDVDWIDHVFSAFYTDGPEIQFWGSQAVHAARPSYRRLMTARDATGTSRSYLATEEGFAFVKDLHSRNMIIPVIGNFAGSTALHRVGDYIRARGDVVHAFYGSNVGVYLTNQQARVFCRNLAALPAASRAWFIESYGVRPLASKLKACPSEAQ